MKIKTAELEGAALDWAVGRLAAIKFDPFPWFDSEIICQRTGEWEQGIWSPSEDWSQAGPLINDKVALIVDTESGCYADCGAQGHVIQYRTPLDKYDGSGPTILIAAMRAIVASELGDEVDVPDELA